jgi:L-threonylcarbamoyladenylate synthase
MSTITQDIDLAIASLRQDNIVAIPTETVYGLAGNAEHEYAIKKIFALKNRPLTHPLIMHIAKEWDISRWVSMIPDYATQLMQAFWPGPLTLVFSSKINAVNPFITGGQTTIAIRSPANLITQQLLTALTFPLVAPSANPFGKISPTTAHHVQQSFKNKPLLILDGGRCSIGIESTIIDATNKDGYQLLRHGAIDRPAIDQVIGYSNCIDQINLIRVPGKLDYHYQPEKPLYCFTNYQTMQQFLQDKPDSYIMSFKPKTNSIPNTYYQLPDNVEQLAYELYYQLRLADASTANYIAIELPANRPAWLGIRERLLKAGQLIV